MLQAILNGKGGRVQSGTRSVSWREIFRTYEDPLTSMVFERFTYLRSSQKRRFLEGLIREDWTHGALEHWVFWPRYDSEDSHVEPDLLLEFEEVVLLLEVKPPLGHQHRGQWKKEVRAHLDPTDASDKPVIFLALGGNTTEDDTTVAYSKSQEIRVIRREWESVRDCLKDLLAAGTEDDAIVSDMLEVLGLYGIPTGVPAWDDLIQFSTVDLSAAMEFLSSRADHGS